MIFSATAQDLPDTCFYQTSDWPEISDSLSSDISQSTYLDTAYAPAFYISLAHYPDLYDTEIHFREKKIKTTAATRPPSGRFLKNLTIAPSGFSSTIKTNKANPFITPNCRTMLKSVW